MPAMLIYSIFMLVESLLCSWYVGRNLLENIKKFDVHSEKLQQNIEKRDAGIEILRLCSKY